MRQTVCVATGTLAAIAACMVAPAGGMAGLGHPLLLIGLGISIVPLVVVAREAWRHQRLASSIARLSRPATIDGRAVALVPGLGAALVAGLRRPQIYCAEDLPARLDAGELRAVILHEHHHQLERGPARLVLISAVAPFVRPFEAGRAWVERERARIEIAADAYALEAGAARPALASALIKLGASPAISAAPGFATAVDLRVRALLGDPIGIEGGESVGQIVAALVLVAGCIALYLR